MFKGKRFGILALCVVALCPWMLHCGGSFCQRSKSALVGIRTKAAPCQISPVTFKVNEEKCEEEKGECSANDLEKIEATISCLNSIPTCSEDKKNEWNGKYSDCTKKLTGLSIRCGLIFL